MLTRSHEGAGPGQGQRGGRRKGQKWGAIKEAERPVEGCWPGGLGALCGGTGDRDGGQAAPASYPAPPHFQHGVASPLCGWSEAAPSGAGGSGVWGLGCSEAPRSRSPGSLRHSSACLRVGSISRLGVRKAAVRSQEPHPPRTPPRARSKGTLDTAFVFKRLVPSLGPVAATTTRDRAGLLQVAVRTEGGVVPSPRDGPGPPSERPRTRLSWPAAGSAGQWTGPRASAQRSVLAFTFSLPVPRTQVPRSARHGDGVMLTALGSGRPPAPPSSCAGPQICPRGRQARKTWPPGPAASPQGRRRTGPTCLLGRSSPHPCLLLLLSSVRLGPTTPCERPIPGAACCLRGGWGPWESARSGRRLSLTRGKLVPRDVEPLPRGPSADRGGRGCGFVPQDGCRAGSPPPTVGQLRPCPIRPPGQADVRGQGPLQAACWERTGPAARRRPALRVWERFCRSE